VGWKELLGADRAARALSAFKRTSIKGIKSGEGSGRHHFITSSHLDDFIALDFK
jgi:hypothetical protein